MILKGLHLGYNGRLFKKLTLSSRFGLERNDLENKELEKRNRLIINANLTVPIYEWWQSTIQLSNLQNTIKLRDQSNPFDLVDSLILVNSTFSFALHNSIKISPSLHLLGLWQQQNVNRLLNEQIDPNGENVFRNALVNLKRSNSDQTISTSFGIGYNSLSQVNFKTNNWSINTNLTWKVNDPLQISIGGNHIWNSMNGEFLGTAMNLILQGQYQTTTNHQIRVNLNIVGRQRKNNPELNFTELLFRLGYSWNFQTTLSK